MAQLSGTDELSAPPAVQASTVPFHQQAAIWTLFLLSGACALIYEVLWCRQLGLVFGNTVHSLSAVLTSFMGGLALGSFVAGRVCHRLKRPLLVYGVLELAIGVYCSLLPWAFSDSGPLVPMYQALYGETGSSSLAITRFAVSFVLMLIPTTFMGATLPILAQYLVRSNQSMGRTVGTLYAVNTLGAVLGAAAAGFILLPALGKIGTNFVAVAFNAILALSAIVVGWRAVTPPNMMQVLTEHNRQKASQSAAAPIPSSVVRFAVLAFGVTGFAAMATQIGWTRAISLGTGSSTYAFSLIVSVFIMGLSLGGWWGSRIASKAPDVVKTLAFVLLAIGMICMALAALLGLGPLMFYFLLAWGTDPGSGGMSWSLLLAIQALGIALLIIVPTFLMGATMPLTLQVAAADSSRNAGRTVGNVYAINTVGSILGSFLGGLVVLPFLEIQTTLQTMALLYALPGIVLLTMSAGWAMPRTRAIAAVLALAVAAGCVAPRWQPNVMSAGMFLLRDTGAVKAAREWRFNEAVPNLDREILYYREGAAATVAVARVAGNISLSVGGKPDASSGGDMSTQIGLTLVPAVLHPAPKEILVIGQGSGVSAGAARARDGVQRVDIVEMSREVITGSSWFAQHNELVYDDVMTERAWLNTPGVETLINDGRNHLLLTSRKYDLIASEPSNPWMAGVGNLFTREAFQLSKERLKPGGIMCQWIHSYALDESHVYSIIRTFGEVFPHIQLWWINKGDYLIVGSESPLTIPIRELRHRLKEPGVQRWLQRVRLDTEEEFVAGFMQHDDALRRKAKDSPLHTDDNMLLEFSAPRALYGASQSFGASQLAPLVDQIVDLDGLSTAERSDFIRRMDLAVAAREHLILSLGFANVGSEHMDQAAIYAPYQFFASFHLETRKFGELRRAIRRLNRRGIPWGLEQALYTIDDGLDHVNEPRWAEVLLKRAAELRLDGKHDEALAALAQIDDPRAAGRKELVRATVFSVQKKYDEALAIVEQVARSGHNQLACAEVAAMILMEAGRCGDAIASLLTVLNNPAAQSDELTQPLWKLLAESCLALTDYAGAQRAADVALRLKNNDPGVFKVLSRLNLSLNKHSEAVSYARRRLIMAAADPEALHDLAAAVLAHAESTPPAEKRAQLSRLCSARRFSRMLITWKPNDVSGWTLFTRVLARLAKADDKNSDVFKADAGAACRKLLELCGNDASKLPSDLRPLLE
ncbi:MAG TPA: fused MFS/spermidine synthase [Planctomycetota bacterium]|nr:fused MFS/spermidine synthase [Planctomycetota bacterium]